MRPGRLWPMLAWLPLRPSSGDPPPVRHSDSAVAILPPPTRCTPEVIVGVVLSVALALIADSLLLGAERVLTPWSRGSRMRPWLPGRKL